MVLSRETSEALRLMGLTDYETQAYIALNSLISANATEISMAANVPRSKVYQVLKGLEEKGFIEMSRGKPLRFTVITPHEVFHRSKNHIKDVMEVAETELNQAYEDQIPKVQAPIWLIHGKDKIVKKEHEIISRAEESLFILGGLMFPEEPEKLRLDLDRSAKKGVKVRALVAPKCKVDDVEVPIRMAIEDASLEIKFFPLPFIKLIVRDKKEMLIVFCKVSEDAALSETAIGIWNQYHEFVDIITGFYDFMWNSDFIKQTFGHSSPK